MRTILLLSLFAISLCLPSRVSASHGMGGEITWTCNGTDYVFRLKFYRDCWGIPGPTTLSLSTNISSLPAIPMTLVSQTDISPAGTDSSGNLPCPNCVPVSGPNAGAVEEFVFESAPTTLPGVPPASGWTFWWGECCRSSFLTNVSASGGYGFSLRATMYPFFGQVSGQCSDASPAFAERPSLIICTGYPFTYNHFASDPDRDSLVYAFAPLLDDAFSLPFPQVPFAPGYTVTSQLPSSIQNLQNSAAVLDPFSGQVSFTSFTSGYFATCVKVSSYKCGQLAAEVFREINIVLIGGCNIPLATPVPNNPPVIAAPFTDTTGTMAVYDTTVQAGNVIAFTIGADDSDPYPWGGAQMVSLLVAGEQFGTGFTNPVSGCLVPPCATFYPPPPVAASGNAAGLFIWQTTPAHLGIGLGCVYFGNVYYFLVKGLDDFCPANGQRVEMIKLTILPNTPVPPVQNAGGMLTCLLTGPYRYQWFLNRFAIPGADSISHTPVTNGFYQVLALDTVSGDGNYSTGELVLNTGLGEQTAGFADFSLVPNPAYGFFDVSVSTAIPQEITLRISDLAGRTVFFFRQNSGPGRFEHRFRPRVPAGMYFVEVSGPEGSAVKKLMLL